MGTWIVAGILLVIVCCIVRYLVRQWKAGHGFCVGGDCKHCGHCTPETGCSGNCASCKGCKK